MEWPPRSLDLTLGDFFLWAHVVCRSQPQTLDELEGSIRTAFHGIDERLCRKACFKAVKNSVTGSWSRDPWGSLRTRDRLQ